MKPAVTRWFDLGLNVACIIVLAVLAYAGLRKGGFVVSAWTQWRTARAESKKIAAAWDTLGALGARLDAGPGPVQIVEFSDYQCPFCKQEHFVLRALLDSLPTLGIGYRHLPNERHPAARGAALAAICAERAGRFREMHRSLFETMEWQTDTNWVKLAESAGIADIQNFEACLRDPAASQRLNEDVKLGERLGVTATPGFVGRRGRVAGLVSSGGLLRLAEGD